MQEYTEFIREYLKDKRDIKRKVFILARRIYRGIENNRFTFEDIENNKFIKI